MGGRQEGGQLRVPVGWNGPRKGTASVPLRGNYSNFSVRTGNCSLGFGKRLYDGGLGVFRGGVARTLPFR